MPVEAQSRALQSPAPRDLSGWVFSWSRTWWIPLALMLTITAGVIVVVNVLQRDHDSFLAHAVTEDVTVVQAQIESGENIRTKYNLFLSIQGADGLFYLTEMKDVPRAVYDDATADDRLTVTYDAQVPQMYVLGGPENIPPFYPMLYLLAIIPLVIGIIFTVRLRRHMSLQVRLVRDAHLTEHEGQQALVLPGERPYPLANLNAAYHDPRLEQLIAARRRQQSPQVGS